MICIIKLQKNFIKISGISIPILSKADSVLSKNNDKLIRTPLICIVGPPRVGSTILYQSVINKLDVDYFTTWNTCFIGIQIQYST